MLPEALSEVLERGEFENEGGIQLRSAEMTDESLLLRLVVDTGVEGDPAQLWSVRCESVRRERLVFEWAEDMIETADHVVLRPFNEDTGELFFSELSVGVTAVVGELYAAHLETVGDWFPFSDFFNASLLRPELRAAAFGSLAEGPVSLLKRFKEVIEKRDGKGSLRNVRRPKRWTGAQWVDEKEGLRALVVGGSFVVAEGFEYVAVEGGAGTPRCQDL
jgi:hypothetical protein